MPRGSQKTKVIERIFEAYFDSATQRLKREVVDMPALKDAIDRCNAERTFAGAKGRPLSTANLANFFKDLRRSEASFRRNWPESVLERGYVGEQATGDARSVFRFVTAPPGYASALPRKYPIAPENCTYLNMQSVELPLAIRRLRRRDETWLIQLAVRLNLIETHLGVVSGQEIEHVSFLQMGIKGKLSEIDALFLADLIAPGDAGAELEQALVTVEAKGISEDITEVQVLNQAKSALRMSEFESTVLSVIPLAIKALGNSRLYIAEYEAVRRTRDAVTKELVLPTMIRLSREAIYTFKPPVEGI